MLIGEAILLSEYIDNFYACMIQFLQSLTDSG